MMVEGVDYSHSRPGPKCLYDSGKRFVVRYVGPNTTSGKWLRAPEMAALRAAGLQIALVMETVAAAPLEGYAEGVEDARQAKTMADGLGIVGRPIYFALDVDPNPLSTAQWNAIKAYCDGAASVIGRHRVGMYGGFKAIEVLTPTWAPYGWQTYAWSAGKLSTKAALYQYKNGVNLCGGELDLCRSLKPDYGQWPFQATGAFMALTDAEQKDMYAKVHHMAVATTKYWQDKQPPDGRFQVQTLVNLATDPEFKAQWAEFGKIKALLAALSAQVTALDAQVGNPVDVDEAAIAAVVVAAIQDSVHVDVDPAVITEAVKVALREGTVT